MQFAVFNIVHYAQIFYAIVRMCAVYVINFISWLQLLDKSIRNKPMN